MSFSVILASVSANLLAYISNDITLNVIVVTVIFIYFLSFILCFRNAVVVVLAGFLIDKVGNPSEFLVEFKLCHW